MKIDPTDLSRDELVKLVISLSEKVKILEQELAALKRKKARSATPFSKEKKKTKRKKPGRKKGKGKFSNRKEPEVKPADNVDDHQAPLASGAKSGKCPNCESKEFQINTELATTIDIPVEIARCIDRFHVEVGECQHCGYGERGCHPKLPLDQHGATAHRVGLGVQSFGLTLHYHYGVTMRKVPGILEEICGIELSQSALTQAAIKKGTGDGIVSQEAEAIKSEIQKSKYVHTDDTGWKTSGLVSYLMGFVSRKDGKPDAVYYQICKRHRAEEVAKVIVDLLGRVLHTDRFKSYDAKQFDHVAMQKCLCHVLKNLSEMLKTKRGKARSFGVYLQKLLRESLELWKKYQKGNISRQEYEHQGSLVAEQIEHHLRERNLTDQDNQRMLNELGWHNGRGNLTRFLEDPAIEPTNNLAERMLRPAVIARKVSQCSKTESGAKAYANFKSVLGTWNLRQRGSSITAQLRDLLKQGARLPV